MPLRYLIATPIVLLVVALAIGALTGRVKARSCCAPPDPAKDRRMRDALGLEPAEPHRG